MLFVAALTANALLFAPFAYAASDTKLASANAPKVVWNEIRTMVLNNDFLKADIQIAKELEKNPQGEDEKTLRYLQGWAAYQSGQFPRALQIADELLKDKNILEEETRALRAQTLDQLGRKGEAAVEDKKLLEMSPNFRLRFESNLRTGRARWSEGRFRDARNIFLSLEKKARGTPGHPDVVIELARAERRMGNTTASCRWFRRLYEKHALHPSLHDWGPDLYSNELDGTRTNCRNTRDDFRDRIRALLWGGEEEKARQEVNVVALAMAKDDRIEADEMRAWFLLQSGDPDQAYRLLEPSAPSRRHDRGFLALFASASARSGQGNAAVGAFHRIWELGPKTAAGRKALYQSAFLSYQFQDYDGASRRFKEFIANNPRSGLSRDAHWNIAWIAYLKGDFEGARKKFSVLADQRRGSGTVKERAKYWMAMCDLRLGHVDFARPQFEALAMDRSGSYYGTVARQRLARLPSPIRMAKLGPVIEGPRVFGPARIGDVLQPSTSMTETAAVGAATPAGATATPGTPAVPDSESTESEETLAADADVVDGGAAAANSADEKEEAANDLVQETGRSEIADEPMVKGPANSRRFERAKILLNLGFVDEARWELYEIERRTRSREDLRNLISIYEQAQQWHRSSSIASLRFAAQRHSLGMETGKELWQAAYPHAFEKEVKAAARDSGLPEEFIWGIMRAESQYRRDAVSPVGALGLMQVMPGTGRKIASLRKEKDFAPPQLLQPATAITFGAYYLKRIGGNFDASIPLTAAAYNAGPHRVHAWLLAFGDLDMDEFIEHIPFLETRDYVRKVTSGAMVYAQLYSGRKSLVDLSAPISARGRPEMAKREVWDPQ